MNTQRYIRQLSYGLLFLGLAWFVAPANGFACERPKERTWLQLLATMPDPCEIGFSTTDASSDMSSSRGSRGVAQQDRAIHFAKASIEPLSQDIAQGGGEYMASLAALMGIPAHQYGLFVDAAQAQFERAADAGTSATAEELVIGLQAAMAQAPAVAFATASR